MLASPNFMVHAYFDTAMALANELAEEKDERIINSKASVIIVLSVTAVEAFINIFGRMWVEQNPDHDATPTLVEDMEKKRFISQKIKTWPKLLFGKNIDLSKGAGQGFLDLVEKRNALIHFNATYQTLEVDNITIKGLTDIALYKSLGHDECLNALETSKDFIESWISLQDIEGVHVTAATQHWIGAYAM